MINLFHFGIITVNKLKFTIADQLARQQRFGGKVRNETILDCFDHGQSLLKNDSAFQMIKQKRGSTNHKFRIGTKSNLNRIVQHLYFYV